MPDPLLRLHDGFAHTSPELRDTVRELQAVLRRHDRAVVVDGLFGRGTEATVRCFQRARGLRADGVVGPATWQALLEPEPPGAPAHFNTGYALDHPQLLEDLEAAARYGASIVAAAADFGIPPAIIVALGSRQSRWGLGLTPRGPSGTADFAPRAYTLPHRPQPLPPDRHGFGRGLTARLRRARVRPHRRLAGTRCQHPSRLRGRDRDEDAAAAPDRAAWSGAAPWGAGCLQLRRRQRDPGGSPRPRSGFLHCRSRLLARASRPRRLLRGARLGLISAARRAL
jgi:hypothetical protein